MKVRASDALEMIEATFGRVHIVQWGNRIGDPRGRMAPVESVTVPAERKVVADARDTDPSLF